MKMAIAGAPSALQGLSANEAAARLAQVGPNVLVAVRRTSSPFTWIVRLIGDPMVLLLAVAGGTYAALGDRFDAIVTAAALFPIFLVTAVLEYRSDRALERLNDMAPPRAAVIRDGREELIPARNVVPGDTLVLREGDIVAADADIVQSARLLVDESSLTGESLPVEKSPQGEAFALAGTIVRSGRAIAVVSRTGERTEYGRIGRTLSRMQRRATPIERAISRLVLQVGIGVAIVCGIVVFVGRAHGDAWGVAVIAGVSLAMAAIPEELPMVYTLYLALGAWRLAKDNALVRRLSSVETLGSTTVICVDKTGTLTQGKLSVDSVFACEGRTQSEVLRFAALASDELSGDPVDAALLAAAPDASARRLQTIPFDPARRYSGMIVQEKMSSVIALKGAYEAILERTRDHAAGAQAFLESAASRGARVLAIAFGSATDGALEETPLTLAGMIALADPVREDAKGAVESCRRAGIRLIMITGDHPATAAAIAEKVGIEPQDVFARTRPEEKLKIVRDLHAQGQIVAMTGDGTNDALALREADIGIAMGKSGTEVARAAADLVLLDDDVTTIVRAVADGRRIFSNLRHAFSYLNSFHAPLLISAFLLPIFGAPILLLPVHLIWLELIVHPTSALVFENDPPHAGLMTVRPRDPKAPLISRRDWRRTLVLGVSLAAAVLAIYLYLLGKGFQTDAARSGALVTMIVGQTLLVLLERAGTRPIWSVPLRDNKTIAPIVLATLAMLFTAIFWPPLAAALHLAPVSWALALVAAGIGAVAVLWTQAFIRLRRT